MTTTQKSEVCPHRAARQRAAAASHAAKAKRKARLSAEVRLVQLAVEYSAEHDTVRSFRGLRGRCEFAEKPDHKCGDPGSPPCKWSTLPQDEWCDYCRAREANLQPFRAALRRRQDLLRMFRKYATEVAALKAGKRG